LTAGIVSNNTPGLCYLEAAMAGPSERARGRLNPFRVAAVDARLCPPPDEDIAAVHRQLPGYGPTPLLALPGLAAELGLGGLWLKDEGQRFGLGAFKALGAGYAIHRLTRGERGGLLTFATATAGNHGRAVAWAARTTGHRAVIFVPGHTVAARVAALRGEGAEVVVVDGSYDDTVRRAAEESARQGWQVVSDTAYAGYEEIPRRIMQGYTTLFAEAADQLAAVGGYSGPGAPDMGGAGRRGAGAPPPRPPDPGDGAPAPRRPEAPTSGLDLVFLQAGVGGLAWAGAYHFVRHAGPHRPRLVVVEPTEADGLLTSIGAPEGALRASSGRLETIMAGLNAGTPSPAAWPLLRVAVDAFIAVDDGYAAEAMRRLAAGAGGDPRVVAGESGAAGAAGLLALAREPGLAAVRAGVGLAPGARVLLVNSEGATDPARYREIVGHAPGG
jgi:diaminopropionate ammonia-lyase